MKEATNPSLRGIVLICQKREVMSCCSHQPGNRHSVLSATLFPVVDLHNKFINLTHSSFHPLMHLPICPFIYVPAHPSILSVCISDHLSTHLSKFYLLSDYFMWGSYIFWEAIYLVKVIDYSLKLPGIKSCPLIKL